MLLSHKKISIISLVVFLCLFLITSAPRAELQRMSDDQLDVVTGEGFSNFDYKYRSGYDVGRTRADFDIGVATYTEVDSFKLGYYEKDGAMGWDQDWTRVKFGSEDQDLVMKGLFLQADYSNPNSNDNRQLTNIQMGFKDVTGKISADFRSITSNLNRDETNQMISRYNLGQKTLTMDHTEFAVILDAQRGFYFNFGNNTTIGSYNP